MKEPDKPRRVVMAEKLLQIANEHPLFFNKILWIDGVSFQLSGCSNLYNVHWAGAYPRITDDSKGIDQRGIMVWVGISEIRGVVGTLFFIESRMNGHWYLDHDVTPALGNLDLYWFMQDGAPAQTRASARSGTPPNCRGAKLVNKTRLLHL